MPDKATLFFVSNLHIQDTNDRDSDADYMSQTFPCSNLQSTDSSEDEDVAGENDEYSDVANEISTARLSTTVKLVVPDITQSSSAILQHENEKLKIEYVSTLPIYLNLISKTKHLFLNVL